MLRNENQWWKCWDLSFPQTKSRWLSQSATSQYFVFVSSCNMFTRATDTEHGRLGKGVQRSLTQTHVCVKCWERMTACLCIFWRSCYSLRNLRCPSHSEVMWDAGWQGASKLRHVSCRIWFFEVKSGYFLLKRFADLQESARVCTSFLTALPPESKTSGRYSCKELGTAASLPKRCITRQFYAELTQLIEIDTRII